MKQWARRLCIVLLLIYFTTVVAGAEDIQQKMEDAYGVDALEDNLSLKEREMIGDISSMQESDIVSKILYMIEQTWKEAGPSFNRTMRLMMRLLVVVILCQLVEAFDGAGNIRITALAGVFGILSICLDDVSALIGMGRDTMERMSSFTKMLLPVMASTAVASGGSVSGTALYAITVFCSNLLLSFCIQGLLPSIYAYLGLSAADCILQQNRLKHLRDYMKWLLELGLKIIGYGFSGLITITGILTGSSDAMVQKGIRTVISTMVPVVGGIISGAADTVLQGAWMLKASVGTFGMLAIISIVLFPFVRIGISWLFFRMLGVICGILDSKLTGLLDAVSSMTGMLLGMIGCCAWIVLLSCCCYLKVVVV